tara:strand:- start:617 stop:2167 length:1551 start_codon:yes stop_codon:yes gene_type:complete
MIDIKPRSYQQAIYETAKDNNTLVVLPTGVGKTLIALLLSIHRLKTHAPSKVLFLAPTRPLVDQHYTTFKKQLPELFADLQVFTGSIPASSRKKIFDTAEIIFSTPQCISNDVKKQLYSLHDVSLIIIDEAHRCLKNYSYTSVVDFYKRQSTFPRILGLTASPGSDPKTVKEICSHLDIDKIEVRNRDSEDVKPYLQTLDFNKVEVPFPQEFKELSVLLKRIYDSCVSKLKQKNLIFGPANKITLLNLQKKLFSKISQKDFRAMYAISLTAQAIKISHALELLETQTLAGLKSYLYQISKDAENKKSKASQNIAKSPDFQAALVSLNQLLAQKVEHPKIEELAVMTEAQLSQDSKSKIMIFTQFRDTATTISQRLSKIKGAKPSVFVGQAKKTSSSGHTTGLNQKEQKSVINSFSSGETNILVATSIGEEGLDIPEVSSVIFYEPIPSAVRKIQRTGRTARLAPGKLFILITKETRDVAYHYASAAREKKMYRTISSVQEDINNTPKTKTLSDFKQ